MGDSPVECDHANENPHDCTCADDCYCRIRTCRNKSTKEQRKAAWHEFATEAGKLLGDETVLAGNPYRAEKRTRDSWLDERQHLQTRIKELEAKLARKETHAEFLRDVIRKQSAWASSLRESATADAVQAAKWHADKVSCLQGQVAHLAQIIGMQRLDAHRRAKRERYDLASAKAHAKEDDAMIAHLKTKCRRLGLRLAAAYLRYEAFNGPVFDTKFDRDMKRRIARVEKLSEAK